MARDGLGRGDTRATHPTSPPCPAHDASPQAIVEVAGGPASLSSSRTSSPSPPLARRLAAPEQRALKRTDSGDSDGFGAAPQTYTDEDLG